MSPGLFVKSLLKNELANQCVGVAKQIYINREEAVGDFV
jgi:hypothetical protein